MGNCYSADHIAEEHIHTHTDNTCDTRKQNRSTTLERSVIENSGGGGA